MKETQPSIISADKHDGYQHALADVTAECAGREQDVFQAQGNPDKLERARKALFRLYCVRQEILDALTDYERQHALLQRRSG